jgi:hypothetical protein
MIKMPAAKVRLLFRSRGFEKAKNLNGNFDKTHGLLRVAKMQMR